MRLKIAVIGLASMALFYCQPNEKLSSGKEIYKKYCVSCHGIDGKLLTNGALDLSLSRISLDERKKIITHGRVNMVGFENVLSSAQIDSVATFTQTLIIDQGE
ncbi:c-type cytochrome [Membranihabitans marinus]|uniref:c-type cytochrome n=1 Tax=Membranihabitans marinus TaxID=1227546 RepID=UPI001F2186DD|nr:cytochrome c [Membranihabitans marinus]